MVVAYQVHPGRRTSGVPFCLPSLHPTGPSYTFQGALILASAMRATTTSTPHYHTKMYCGSDNFATVSWATKGSTSSTGANMHLLRWLAQLSRQHLFNLTPVFVSGKSNHLADIVHVLFIYPITNFCRN